MSVKKHYIILFFSFVFALRGTAQSVVNPTTNPQPTANISPCYNDGFESTPPGSYTAIPGWTITATTYTNVNQTGVCQDYMPNNSSVGSAGVFTLPTVAPFSPTIMIPNSPFGGQNALSLYGGAIFYGFNSAERTFSVTPNNKYYQYAYYTFMYLNSHNCCDANYIKVRMYDCNNNLIPCASLLIASTYSNCAGSGTVGMSVSSPYNVYTPNWVVRTVDLSAYVGTCARVIFEAGECDVGGHPQSLYIDSRCVTNLITSNGSANGNTITVCPSQTAVLTSISAASYSWNGPPLSIIINATTQAITTTVSGVYTLAIGNPGCASITSTFQVNICNNVTGLDYQVRDDFTIFPNPSTGNITIKGTTKQNLLISDVSGRIIERFNLEESNEFSKQFNDLKKGVYIISGNNFKKKIIVLDQ
jgi:hypothetical protein